MRSRGTRGRARGRFNKFRVRFEPGPVRTPFWTAPGGFADATAAAAGTTAQAALDVVVPQNMGISSGRVTEAHEVSDLTLFLASPLAANITGTETLIDGGRIKTL
ncbi:SDR family oxidoreductase [Streptomyces sp. NBC_01728]|uniref:SDR family oxidoreductase n=1 Tax=unclassified Streptomyces TaxID=2593676 RepID=UPI00225C199E|nr:MULTISPECIES: SDR family oxidoreductase [unclassified Streptomyces]MCX4461578.1 SDR family oxidoreductase [Streptomyces sp. NBC_01719]MCX4490485.1 SDR family oxidoreductase [Streptomyces sp. NBC_01728]